MPRSDAVITIDESALTPPYAQVFEQIRAMIERGEVKAGYQLPPVRQLAGDLGVAPNTIARAYADLKADGWVEGEERKPTRIAARAPTLAKTTRRRALGDAVSSFLSSLTNRGYVADEIAAELQKGLAALSR